MFQTSLNSDTKTKDSSAVSRQKKSIVDINDMMQGHESVPSMSDQPAQRMVKEEEKKPKQKKAIQMQEEEELQMKEAQTHGQNTATSSQTGIPEGVQTKMENSFGTSFSNVNIHQNDNSATDMGALAYTQGNDVHFAPGQYNPNTQSGQELLGHELTHVVQQRQGRVKANKQGKGFKVNDEPALETEADVMGKKAAEGQHVNIVSSGTQDQVQMKQALPGGARVEALRIDPDTIIELLKDVAIKTDEASGSIGWGHNFNAESAFGAIIEQSIAAKSLTRIPIDYIEREFLDVEYKGYIKFRIDNIKEISSQNTTREITNSGSSKSGNSLSNSTTNGETISAGIEKGGVSGGVELSNSRTRSRTDLTEYNSSNSSKESVSAILGLYEADVSVEIYLDANPSFEGGLDWINPVKWASAITSISKFDSKSTANVGKVYYYDAKF